MREIKFRAWDNNKRIMLSPIELRCFQLIELEDNKRYKWMQYTGLKDKNRVEIYEGDILSIDEMGKIEVKWDDKRFGWSPFISKDKTDWEVIGNIYKNPELLTN